MSRIIDTDSTGKRRNQHMRSAAELLHRLIKKQAIDEEARDMLATLVYLFRDIDSGLDDAVEAWERRDYWVKAEQFRRKWAWVGMGADELEALIRAENWPQMPVYILKMLPHFEDIQIVKFTRDESLWQGQYARLMGER